MMTTAIILLALTMALAGANGANDVSKGIAALAGSGFLHGIPALPLTAAFAALIGADRAPPRAGDALRGILRAWLVTLPSAALIAAAVALVTRI